MSFAEGGILVRDEIDHAIVDSPVGSDPLGRVQGVQPTTAAEIQHDLTRDELSETTRGKWTFYALDADALRAALTLYGELILGRAGK